jgi:hypothetical protein
VEAKGGASTGPASASCHSQLIRSGMSGTSSYIFGRPFRSSLLSVHFAPMPGRYPQDGELPMASHYSLSRSISRGACSNATESCGIRCHQLRIGDEPRSR